jgi:DNA ligase-1
LKAFARLFSNLDRAGGTNEKLDFLSRYFETVSAEDGAWAVYFLSGRRLKRLVLSGRLRSWAADAAGLPDWLFEECYEAVGDLAETIALVLPASSHPSSRSLAKTVSETILPLRGMPEDEQRRLLQGTWSVLGRGERLVWNKLLTGGFRVGVSQQTVVRALARATGAPAAVLTHRLMGNWEPGAEFYRALVSPDTLDADHSRPYPFYLAYPLNSEPEELGDVQEWQLEWKWDGIRAQLVLREGTVNLWSRGEELVDERFPEIVESARRLPTGTVLDGEILAWNEEGVLPFASLQRRIGRKSVSKRLLQSIPAVLVAFDLLEFEGEDCRLWALRRRREQLEQLLNGPAGSIRPSPLISVGSWEEARNLREESRSRGVEGIMLKRLDSPYDSGRKRGNWWKWKVAPYTVDAVLIYAQRGHGRRAGLYTDYTFAIWNQGSLVPFAKAYSGLSDAEIREVDRFVRSHTVERFGPVRSVEPVLVFELAFENIQESKRHKSGIAVRFPRMLRRRRDKKPEDADSLDRLRSLLRGGGE